MMENTEIIKALRECEYCDVCSIAVDGDCPFGGRNALEVAAADALEAADEKIADCVAAIDALDDSNDAYIKENERLKKRIEELEEDIIYWWQTYSAEIER